MRSKRQSGQSAVELIAGLTVLIPLVFVGIDIATIFMGAQMCEAVCNDAARAAAAGPPNEIAANQPYLRASQVVNKNIKSTGAIRLETLKQTDVTETLLADQSVAIPKPPFGGFVNAEISVQTYVDVYTPFIVGSIIGKVPIRVPAKRTYKFTWVMTSTFSPTFASNTSNGGSTGGTSGGSTAGTNSLSGSGGGLTNPPVLGGAAMRAMSVPSGGK